MVSGTHWMAAAAAILTMIAVATTARADTLPSPAVVAGYLPAWTATPDVIATLPAEELTHIIYAFGAVTADGVTRLGDPCLDVGDCGPGRPGGGNFAALKRLKERHPHLKVMIALGGWTGSGHFSDAAASPERRARLADSAVELFMVAHGEIFDGIEIDWEYPVGGGLPSNRNRPEDRQNLTLLVTAMRTALDRLPAAAERPLLTVAVPGNRWLMQNFEIEKLAELVDWFGLMTYDYAAGAMETAFNAPLFAAAPADPEAPSVDRSVEDYLGAGAPPERIVLGLPFYGRAFGGVEPGPIRDGFGQPGTPAPETFWKSETIPYHELLARDLGAQGFEEYRHALADAPWLYHPGRGIWITYDDPRSLERKADFVRIRRLRGVMIWELTADPGHLVQVVSDSVRK